MEIQQPYLGKKIVKLRKAKGLTQEELVEKCNISVRTLQRIEAGEVTPRSYTVKLIFNALGHDAYDSVPELSERLGFHKIYNYVTDLFNLKTNAMKKLTILSIFFISVITIVLTACLGTKKVASAPNELVGTWQYTNNGVPDTTFDGQPGQIRYKVITSDRFVVTDIQYQKKAMYGAFTGPYKVDTRNKVYQELVDATGGGGYARFINGKWATYYYKIVDSLWYIKGNGYDEVWKKVK